MSRYAVLMVLVLLAVAPQAQADFYRWVDKNGQEYFTNEKAKIPEEYRDTAQPVEVREDRVSVGDKPTASSRAAAAVTEHKDKYGHGEEYWRKRAANLRLKLRDLQDEYDLLLKQEAQRQEAEKKVIGKKKKSTASFEKKKAKLEKEIAKTRRMLEVDLPEEARKADAYPGWVRE